MCVTQPYHDSRKSSVSYGRVILLLEQLKSLNNASICIPIRSHLLSRQTSNWSYCAKKICNSSAGIQLYYFILFPRCKSVYLSNNEEINKKEKPWYLMTWRSGMIVIVRKSGTKISVCVGRCVTSTQLSQHNQAYAFKWIKVVSLKMRYVPVLIKPSNTKTKGHLLLNFFISNIIIKNINILHVVSFELT